MLFIISYLASFSVCFLISSSEISLNPSFVITAMSIFPPDAESLFVAAVIALIAISIPSLVVKSSL